MHSPAVSRRQFVHLTSRALAGGLALQYLPAWAGGAADSWDPSLPLGRLGRELKVQPVLMYRLPERKEAASWKSWGGIQTESAVDEELRRISAELAEIQRRAEFRLSCLPVVKVSSPEQARGLADSEAEVTLLYACTGGSDLLRACLAVRADNLIFVRHRSGPVYYWYEALSVRLLASSETSAAGTDANFPAHVDDVVVDDPTELLWRLRALHGVQNLRRTRVVALGGPWGKYATDAPDKARERFGMNIIDVGYEAFFQRLKQALADPAVMTSAEQWTDRYLALPQTTLETQRSYVVNAFVLYRLFKELLAQHKATAFTIKSCMGTILPAAQTTACLTLALLNDEGSIGFCESDFVIIPAGLLLRHIAGKPVFLHNSTFPHRATVTCAHCTCPRRLDGSRYEPTRLLTHYESEFGAAPKVAMPVGQEVTFVDPDYSTPRWLGFKGVIKDNPFYDICRSQQDVEIKGDWKQLVHEVRDSHWVMVYGDYLSELGFAARKLGLQWASLTS